MANVGQSQIGKVLAHGPDRWAYSDVVALDFGFSSLKALRIRRVRNQVQLVDAALLPAHSLESDGAGFSVPHSLKAKYAACCGCSEKTLLRLVPSPASLSPDPDGLARYLKEQLGITDGYRCGAVPINRAANARLVAIAMPELGIQNLLKGFPSGSPAACSMEVSGLSALNALLLTAQKDIAKNTVCLLDAGAKSIFLTFIHNGQIVLVRKSDTGGEVVVEAVMRRLEAARDTAMAIISGQSIDISSVMAEVLDFTFRQISLSRDYVEREHNTKVNRLYLAGGLALNTYWRTSISEMFGVPATEWDPFSRMILPSSGLPAETAAQRLRFAAAAGAAMAMVNRGEE